MRRHEEDLEAPRAAAVPQKHVDGVPPQRITVSGVGDGLVPLTCEERRRATRDRRVHQRTQRLYTVLVVADVRAQNEVAGRQGIGFPIQFFDRYLAPTQGLDPAVARHVSSEEREVLGEVREDDGGRPKRGAREAGDARPAPQLDDAFAGDELPASLEELDEPLAAAPHRAGRA